MNTLNLTATTTEEKKILKYLNSQASDVLVEKINNGVYIEKDGKRLLNKKDITTFIKYAEEEVLKLIAENERKGRQVRCIDDQTVYGWSIHYFEEDSIEGNLYNEDGTEYKPIVKTKPKTTVTTTVKSVPQKPQPQQANLFDMLNPSNNSTPTDEENDEDNGEELNSDYTPEELQELAEEAEESDKPVAVEQPKPEPKKGSSMYQSYLSVKEKYKDCIVFFRLGDFYEMYNSDAVTAANVLNLTLTGRDYGLDERIPMVGIPFHASDTYLSKLVAAGYKVAVCEPLDGKTERTVKRIISKQPENDNLVDIETGEILQDNEEISVEEMQKFDGDIEEPEEVPTISKILAGVDLDDEQDETDDDFDIEKERERLKAFDKNAIIILSDLLGNIFTLE